MIERTGAELTPYFYAISACRVCGEKNLTPLFNLGDQALTGIFPKSENEFVPIAPLALVLCGGCGLVQLRDTVQLGQMYGENYGYRSGLNPSMEAHLSDKARWLEKTYRLASGDLVVDIGSNDGTFLHSYVTEGLRKVGVDPTGLKFSEFYGPDITLVPDFFSANSLETLGFSSAKIVTSIAMFYDLEKPKQFVEDISRLLARDGVWHFEQSYLPAMLGNFSYDTICHEHLEYYSFKVVNDLLESCGMEVLEVRLNSVNGGSFAVTAARINSGHPVNTSSVKSILSQEDKLGVDGLQAFEDFSERMFKHREELVGLIRSINDGGQKVFGYGASTKGNVLLQFCEFTAQDLECIVEVNENKFGSFTPGTKIPIVSEAEARSSFPDYMLVLPWHFRDFIIEKEKAFLKRGGKLIFPLPNLEVVSR